MRRYLIVFVVAAVTALGLAAEQPKVEKPLTNGDVVELSNSHLGDDIVVAKVRQAPSETLDVSTDALVALKKSGVSNAIIDAMLKRVALRGAGSPPASTAAATSGAKTTQPAKPQQSVAAGERPCVQNFTQEGSLWKGRQYKTFVTLGKTDRNAAFDRAAQFIATDGWRVATSTRDTGIITASQDVNWSDGKTAPLSVVLKETSEGIIVQVAFSTPAGTSASKDEVVKAFCGITDAAAGN